VRARFLNYKGEITHRVGIIYSIHVTTVIFKVSKAFKHMHALRTKHSPIFLNSSWPVWVCWHNIIMMNNLVIE